METVLNLNSVMDKMKTQRPKNKIYVFFDGARSYLKKDQIEEIISILEFEHEKVIKYLRMALKEKLEEEKQSESETKIS